MLEMAVGGGVRLMGFVAKKLLGAFPAWPPDSASPRQ